MVLLRQCWERFCRDDLVVSRIDRERDRPRRGLFTQFVDHLCKCCLKLLVGVAAGAEAQCDVVIAGYQLSSLSFGQRPSSSFEGRVDPMVDTPARCVVTNSRSMFSLVGALRVRPGTAPMLNSEFAGAPDGLARIMHEAA